MAVREVSAKTVCDAIRHGFGRPGTGGWPHVAGVSAEGDAKTPEEVQKKWNGKITFTKDGMVCDPNNPSEPDAAKTVKVAGVPYLLCGGDEYPVLAVKEKGDGCMDALKRNPILDSMVTPPQPISALAEKAIVEAGSGGIKPP